MPSSCLRWCQQARCTPGRCWAVIVDFLKRLMYIVHLVVVAPFDGTMSDHRWQESQDVEWWAPEVDDNKAIVGPLVDDERELVVDDLGCAILDVDLQQTVVRLTDHVVRELVLSRVSVVGRAFHPETVVESLLHAMSLSFSWMSMSMWMPMISSVGWKLLRESAPCCSEVLGAHCWHNCVPTHPSCWATFSIWGCCGWRCWCPQP